MFTIRKIKYFFQKTKIANSRSLSRFLTGNAIFRHELVIYFLPNYINQLQTKFLASCSLPKIMDFDNFLEFPLYFLYKCKGNPCLSGDVRVRPLKSAYPIGSQTMVPRGYLGTIASTGTSDFRQVVRNTLPAVKMFQEFKKHSYNVLWTLRPHFL